MHFSSSIQLSPGLFPEAEERRRQAHRPKPARIPDVVEVPSTPPPRAMSGSDARLAQFIGRTVIATVRSLQADCEVRGQLVHVDEAAITIRQVAPSRIVTERGSIATAPIARHTDYRFSRGSIVELRAAKHGDAS